MAKAKHSDGVAERPLTRNERTVQDALIGQETPLTAYEILARPTVQRAGIKAPLTVYRALDKLIARGLVHRIESLNAFLACEHAPHDHASGFLICAECGRTREVPLAACERHLTGHAKDAGFDIDAVRVEMTGRCPDCASAT